MWEPTLRKGGICMAVRRSVRARLLLTRVAVTRCLVGTPASQRVDAAHACASLALKRIARRMVNSSNPRWLLGDPQLGDFAADLVEGRDDLVGRRQEEKLVRRAR